VSPKSTQQIRGEG